MPLTKDQKKKILENLREKVNKQRIMLFVSVSGVKVKDLFDLRKRLKKVESQITVVKKTLARIIFKEKGVDIDSKKIPGEAAIVFGFEDEVSPAKVVYELSQINQNIKFLGGFFANKLCGPEEMIALAQIPPKNELLGRLVGSIASPLSGLENVLQGNLRKLVFVLSQIKGQ